MALRMKYLIRKILAVLFLFISFDGKSGKEDSLKYDLNDPRNPKCPCHKYQKIAEEEYRKLLVLQEKKTVNKISSSDRKISSSEANSWRVNSSMSTDVRKKKSRKTDKLISKRKTKKHTRWKKMNESLHQLFVRKRNRGTSCFNW